MGFSVFVTILLTLSLSSLTVTPSLDRLQLNLTRTPYNMLYALVVVNISLGTPPVEVVLVMDTGSSLTWTQCQPCPDCFKQHPPYYNSAASKTFRKVPCGGGPICKECVHNKCVYEVSYGGGTSKTRGLAATKTFSFSGGASAAGVLFGCSKTATP